MTACRPIRPFRCWQYRKADESPVPRWIASHLMDLQGGEPKFYDSECGEWKLEEGDWIVRFTEGEGAVFGIYGDEQFRAQYTLEAA